VPVLTVPGIHRKPRCSNCNCVGRALASKQLLWLFAAFHHDVMVAVARRHCGRHLVVAALQFARGGLMSQFLRTTGIGPVGSRVITPVRPRRILCSRVLGVTQNKTITKRVQIQPSTQPTYDRAGSYWHQSQVYTLLRPPSSLLHLQLRRVPTPSRLEPHNLSVAHCREVHLARMETLDNAVEPRGDSVVEAIRLGSRSSLFGPVL